MNLRLILTCEHASNKVPEKYTHLFDQATLNTHRGYDIGAAYIYDFLRAKFNCYAQHGDYSRLLIELNRSTHHHHLFSEFSKKLSGDERKTLIAQIYLPYQTKLIKEIEKAKNPILHISVHSFTPVLNDIERNADIGLLYDPKKSEEKIFCRTWQHWLSLNSPYRVRLNYPYRGNNDGLTSLLRKQFPQNYMGIELEINQKLLLRKQAAEEVAGIIYNSLLTIF